MSVNAPDFTKSPPRSGRTMVGGWPWLARLADKVRAEQAGTNGDYVAYCGISRPFLEICGVPQSRFDELIRSGKSDEDLARWFDEHVDAKRREAARRFILEDKAESLARQDAEEGRG
jgi:hypothetical protein